jgi:hypothetical protein
VPDLGILHPQALESLEMESTFSSNFPEIDATLSSGTTEARHPASKADYSDFIQTKLQPSKRLGLLLKYCFDELEIYYPCIDRADFYARLSTLFARKCSYRDGLAAIPIIPEDLALAALTCLILALATYMSGQSTLEELVHAMDDCAAAAWQWHRESRRLLAEFSWDTDPPLDMVRYHLLETIFHTMLEKSRAQSVSKAMAVELAFALELNNENSWRHLSRREREYRRLLWWMVYIVDRRISIRTCRPYLIQDCEFAVGEFSADSRICYLSDTASVLHGRHSDAAFDVYEWPLPEDPAEDWFAYLQFKIGWSKIAARVWNNCCSLRSSRAVDLGEINAIDRLLLTLERSLSPSLLWNQHALLDLVQAGKTDRYLRLRLIIFEVCH